MSELFESDELAHFLESDEVVAATMEVAQRAAEYWRSIAPEDSGEYKDSIHAARYGNEVYVQADDPKAYLIEYGTVDTPEFACRARTEAYFNAGGQ